jgi:hypothetical protein
LLAADLHRAGFHLRKPPIFYRVGIAGSGSKDWLKNNYEFIVCTTRGGRLPWSDNKIMGQRPKWAPGGAMSHRLASGERVNQRIGRRQAAGWATSGHKNGDTPNGKAYNPPDLANPGNVIHCKVGGGHMGGDAFSKQNEAPFPEQLVEFFVPSFCRPGGTVLDPFCGSGTTVAVAHRWGRHGLGIDLRPEQIDLSRRRLEQETPLLFA